MATSPAFVGTPRVQATICDEIDYAAQTVFTAGASGSVIKSFYIAAAANQPLFAQLRFGTYYHCTVPIQVTAIADFNQFNLTTGQNILTDTYFPGIEEYLDLGANETVEVTIHDGAGVAPAAGEYAFIRIVGADY